MKIGIIGLGHVGTAILSLFPDAITYDKNKNIGSKEDINKCDVSFVCVPTPTIKGKGCDTSIVDEVISWCQSKYIIIRSTVPVGFTDEEIKKYNKHILFQPEYYGETKNHPYKSEKDIPWITLGGDKNDIKEVSKIYEKFNIKINEATAKEAEMAKYMCNLFLATKVTFANEMYDFCQVFGIDYDNVKNLFIQDPRIGKTHLDVYKDNRGFGGSCFPKDTEAFYLQAKKNKVKTSLLKSTIKTNKRFKKLNKNN